MQKQLLIVESPAKAKTIEKFLGKDYVVASSYGHIRDLPKVDLAVDVQNNFSPEYVVPSDKKALVKELKKLGKEASVIWLATDEDREGEAISWHLTEVLGLDKETTKRIVFHEITKSAISRSMEHPRTIDMKLVNAQQARRVLDRIVGYQLSPVLWKKVKRNLSAGRVQSVAVRLIVEREKEISEFTPESFFRIKGHFSSKQGSFNAELDRKIKEEKDVLELLQNMKSDSFVVTGIQKKPIRRSSAPPFTTSTLQQEASRRLGYPVARTMRVAQKLYESGHITYMRTDSVHLSDEAVKAAGAAIVKNYGEEYANPKQYVTKSKSAQEAHEAIRPTNCSLESAGGKADEKKLYHLIWRRMMASQMADAVLEKTEVNINGKNSNAVFIAKGEVVRFDGFLKLYATIKEDNDEDSGILPVVTVGEQLDHEAIHALQGFSAAPGRFSEAALVKKMEELGIGRPSTYAPTISTIQKRNYVSKGTHEGTERELICYNLKNGVIEKTNKTERWGSNKGRLVPSDIGMIVNEFLVKHFDHILDYGFTANLENKFDEVAAGKCDWHEVIKEFYGPFDERIKDTLEHAEKPKGERLLGIDPESGKKVFVRMARYGPIAQIGEIDDPEKKFASLLKDQSIRDINLEDALKLFQLPRIVGTFEDEEIVAAIGKYGPYLRHKGKFYKLTKHSPIDIELGDAEEVIILGRESAPGMINEFKGNPAIHVLNGRYGPYIKAEKKNYRIPKKQDPAALTREDCLEIIEAQKSKAAKK